MKKPLAQLLHEKNILKYGDFTLRSGAHSTYYCDIKEAFGHPLLLKRISDELISFIPKQTTCIAGSGYGGITLATLVAYKTKLPLVLVRDKVKDHGTKKVIDGYIPARTDTVCIIDDVYTTGSSISETREKLIPLGVKLSKPLVVVNRSSSRAVLSLLNDTELKKLSKAQ